MRAAELGVEAGARQFLVVPAVERLPYRAVWIVRPALLLGERAEKRRGERIAASLVRPLSPRLAGPLRRYRPVRARDVAATTVRLAKSGGTGGVVEIEQLGPEVGAYAGTVLLC